MKVKWRSSGFAYVFTLWYAYPEFELVERLIKIRWLTK
jgi:hypothetical protein